MRFLFLYCLVGSVCFFQDVKACEQHEYRIACVGDSITTGHYPQVLKKLLGDNAEVRVYAHKGFTVSSVVMEELYDATEHWNPTHVVFYAGINDCVREVDDLLAEDEKEDIRNGNWVIGELNHVVGRVQSRNAKIILIKHHPWAGYRKRGYQCSALVNEWLDEEKFAYEGATVVETLLLGDGLYRLRKRYDAGDGLHLNYEGDKVLAGLVARSIR